MSTQLQGYTNKEGVGEAVKRAASISGTSVANFIGQAVEEKVRAMGLLDQDESPNIWDIVSELIKNGMVDTRLTASGKGDTMPVADNSTKAGKESNRRTEFVVTPKIDGLYKMYKEEIMMSKGEGGDIK